MRPHLIAVALVTLTASVCAAQEMYLTPEAFAENLPRPCDAPTIDFEEAPYGIAVGDRYPGVYLESSVVGATVHDVVPRGNECRGVRCVRTGEDDAERDYAPGVPRWISLDFDPPIDAMSVYVIGAGVPGDPMRTVTIEARQARGDHTIFEFEAPEEPTPGGSFVGLVFKHPVSRVVVSAPSGYDHLGIDDLWFTERACLDLDHDGFSPQQNDCDDTEQHVHPNALEVCNGIDDDCDGMLLPGAVDIDRDGFLECEDPDGDGYSAHDGDCAPFEAHIHPGADELCDGLDTDCDGVIPRREHDRDLDGAMPCDDPDGDGVTEYEGDCAPHDPESYPGAPELCDGRDNACTGAVPNDELDLDRDGFAPCAGDCDDADPRRFPGAREVSNGWDDNCDGKTSGGTVGCESVDSGGAPVALSLLLLLLLAGRRLFVPGRRRWVVLVSAVVGISALGAPFNGDDELERRLNEPEYQEAIRASDHGKQFALQLNESLFEELVVEEFFPVRPQPQPGHAHCPDLARFFVEQLNGGASIPTCLRLHDPEGVIWISDVDARLLEGEDGRPSLRLGLRVAGWLQSPRREPRHEISGELVAQMALIIEGDCVDNDLTLAPSDAEVDVTGLRAGHPSDAVEMEDRDLDDLRDLLEDALQVYVVDQLTLPDLNNIVCQNPLVSSLEDEPDVMRPAELGANVPGYVLQVIPPEQIVPLLKVIEAPANGTEPVLMVGWDSYHLPDCTRSPGDIFQSDAFERFDRTLIQPGHGAAYSVSTRALGRLAHNILWRMRHPDGNGGRVKRLRTALIRAYRDLACNRGSHRGSSMTLDDNWTDHEPQPADASDPFATVRDLLPRSFDPCRADAVEVERLDDWPDDEAICDGTHDGRYFIDLTAPERPQLRAYYRSRSRFGWWIFNTTVELAADLRLRLFVDRSPPGEGDGATIRLSDEISYSASGGCAADCAGATREAYNALSSQLESLSGTLAQVSISADMLAGYGLEFGRVDPYPATIALSLRHAPPPMIVPGDGEPVSRIDRLPVGAIGGLNLHQAGSPEVGFAGHDPIERQCPVGWRSRRAKLSGWSLSWCEKVEPLVDPDPLPPGAWCGLSVRDRFSIAIADDGEDPFESTCEGDGDDRVAPGERCPRGFEQVKYWLSREALACANNDIDLDGCREINLEKPDITTCVARGGLPRPDVDLAALPAGLTLEANFAGLGWPAHRLEGCFDGETYTARNPTVPIKAAIGGETPAGVLETCSVPDTGPDHDGDGLSLLLEDDLETDPFCRSTDGDMIDDAREAALGWDPASLDTDRDGLSDFEEFFHLGTDPLDVDTDDDGLPDGYEVYTVSSDPLDPHSLNANVLDGDLEWAEDFQPPRGGRYDSDCDGWPDGFEKWVLRTDPHTPDPPPCLGIGRPSQLFASVDAPWYGGAWPRCGEGDVLGLEDCAPEPEPETIDCARVPR